MKKCAITIIGAALLLPALAAAQTAATAVTPTHSGERAIAEVQTVAGRLATTVEARTTTGRPYSAEAITESFHLLGDGNRIQNRNVTRIYRDGEGRTRREVIGSTGTPRTITISDPIARTNYTLEPETRTAYSAPGLVVLPTTRPGTYTTTAPDSTAPRAKVEEVRERSAATTVAQGGGRGGGSGSGTGSGSGSGSESRAVIARGGGGGRGGARGELMPSVANDQNVKREDLGTQTVEGVAATGTRTTTVIPAGAIGNLQEIRIVSEQWFSPDLQVLVMTKHSDPRSGETTYKLMNIVRAEPDPGLFTVPADYTIKGRAIR